MKTKTLLSIKVIALIVFLLCALFTTFSCSNLFSGISTDDTPGSGAGISTRDSHRTITVTGTIRNPYEQPRNQSRSAMPSYVYSDKKYVVTATAQGETKAVSGTADTTNNTFSIPLTLGKIWTINVQLLKKETGDADYVKVMEGTYTFTEALTEVNAGISIEIRPTITESGTGKIALEFATPTDALYDSVAAEPVIAEQKTAWNAANASVSEDSISVDSIKSGVYSVTIRFYKSNVLVYATMQEISVYDNMTTSVWDDGGANSPISGGTFTVTQALIDTFKRTSIFVASATSSPAGNNNNSGTPYSPIASINEALRRISVTGSANENYTIWLMSDITENVSMKGTAESGENIALNGKASSITIQPMGNSITISGATNSAFDISTSVPITFENLTITENTHGTKGGAFNMHSYADVTLSNCSVTGNSVTNNGWGGAIYNMGTLNIKGKVIITGNSSSGVENNIQLYQNKKINIVGPLDPDSRIGVLTGIKPSYGSPVVFTSGFEENSGLENTAISTIFTCDEGYAVLAGTGTNAGEAVLEASGGSMSDVFDYSVALSCEDEEVAAGSAITVAAAVTRNGTAVTPVAGDITWNFELLCYGDSVATIPSYAITPAAGSARVAIPPSLSLFEGITYTLHASAIYNGIAYDNDFTLTASRLGFVSVAGATISGAISGSQVFIAGRTVTIPNMYVSNHEVTQAEYQAVMGTNPSNFINSPASGENQANRPVEKTSWYDAIMYCNKKSMADGLTPCYAVNGKIDPSEWGYTPHTGSGITETITCDFNADGYRLPTDAEWEYIARGGNGLSGTQYTYSGSDTQDGIAWYSENSNSMTHEVMKKAPNSLGIYDMTGNVDEWCWDFFGGITVDTPSTGPTLENGSHRVLRGGNFGTEADCSVSRRFTPDPTARMSYRGFRVVCTAPGTPLASGTSGTAGTTATYMYFGEWPQTIKASGVTVDETVSKEVGMFTYYFGSDGAWYIKQTENGYASAADSTYSDGTTVAQGGTSDKYFKVEPIKWRVLTTDFNGTGKKLLLAENILTNGSFYPYNENRTIDGVTVYQHNWKYSRIRAYLNGTSYNLSGTQNNEFVGKGFLQTAFTSSLQSKIVTALLDNSAASASEGTPEAYLCGNTYDNVFFLSAVESGSYGLNNASRIRTMSDFAKATGALGDWWLRTPYSSTTSASNPCVITDQGKYSAFNAIYGYHGIVPAICFDD